METKSCSARSLGCIANGFGQCDSVQNILKEILAQSKQKQNKTKQKSHDACLEKIKTEYVYIYYIHVPYIKKPM